MKTTSIILSALLVASVALSASAADPANTGLAIIPVTGSHVYKVVYKSETEGKVKLNLYNASSQLVYSEILNTKGGFILPLNLKGLTVGEYTVVLEDANGIKQTEKINFAAPASNVKYVHVSKMASEEGKFLLSVIGNNNSEVNVRILSGNDVIYNETKKLTGEYAQVFNVQSFPGDVTFEVTDNTGIVSTVHF